MPLELLLLAQIAYGICTKSFVGCGFAPDPLGELTSLPKALAGLGVGPTWNGKGEGRGKGGREGKGGEGVPECPNPELASLCTTLSVVH